MNPTDETEYAEWRLDSIVENAFHWLIRLACWYGYSFGWKQRNKDTVFMPDDPARHFKDLEYYWYIGHGGSINAEVIGTNPRNPFTDTSFGDPTITNVRAFDMGSHRERISPTRLTRIFEAIDTEIETVFKGIHRRNGMRYCESPLHTFYCERDAINPDEIKTCTLLGGVWVCGTCSKGLRLAAPMPLDEGELVESDFARTERAKMTESLRFSILERDGFRCRACGRNPREHGIVLHVDHILAIANGGKTEPDNLQALCDECNLAKRARRIYQMELWGVA